MNKRQAKQIAYKLAVIELDRTISSGIAYGEPISEKDADKVADALHEIKMSLMKRIKTG